VNQKLEDALMTLYRLECTKIADSVKERCDKDSHVGMSQMIGRRYGFFWEEMVKSVYEHHFKDTSRHGLSIDISTLIFEAVENELSKYIKDPSSLKTSIQSIKDKLVGLLEADEIKIADFLYTVDGGVNKASEIKWRIRWNDAKTVKAHALGAHRLKNRGYQALMLVRRPRAESFEFNFERFEREGWIVKTGDDTMTFIKQETGFDLDRWIKNNVNFWQILTSYHEQLRRLGMSEKDFEF
jgi:hypothetical protein